jgi:hypothetical protein
MAGRKHTLEFDTMVVETEKAHLVSFGAEEVWVPKSISEVDINYNSVVLPEWFIIENELEGFIV